MRSSKGNTHYQFSSQVTCLRSNKVFACRLSASSFVHSYSHGVTSSFHEPLMSRPFFPAYLQLGHISSVFSVSSSFSSSSSSSSRESECERRCALHPREITYDSQCTCLCSLVLALYNRSLFLYPAEITDSE